MKLSNGQLLGIAAVVGVAGWALTRGTANDPLGLNAFRAIMTNPATEAEQAAYWAARAGRTPSPAGVSGLGATSVQPVYAGLLAGLGSTVTSLFKAATAPGNRATGTPQASASSGGGIAQPAPTYMPPMRGILMDDAAVGDWLPVGDLASIFADPLDFYRTAAPDIGHGGNLAGGW